MSGSFLLDATALSVSVFNTLLIAWLGLTVLFNAERRTWGVIIAAAGLFAGAAFFLAHSIILSQGAGGLLQEFSFWWHVGWAPVIIAPYSWYLLNLWYAGFWDDTRSWLRRRQLPWLALTMLFALLLACLLLAPSPEQPAARPYADSEGFIYGGIPLILIFYPPFILLCIGLALDALLRPAPSGRVLGDLARQRARPWLVGTTLLLLVVGMSVGVVFLWLAQAAIPAVITSLAASLSLVDLALAALLMAVCLMLGQAIISYEIFTGKTLPRRGLQQQWRLAVLLVALLSLVVGFGVTARQEALPLALELLGVVVLVFAINNRLSVAEHEASLRQLRPLMTSQRMFESILTPEPAGPLRLDLAEPFHALCREVLNARQAALLPLGSLAALGCPALQYPPGAALHPPAILAALGGLLERFISPQGVGLQLDPARSGGFIWAAPLWSERGLVGLLLLGEKTDGGVYALEEIEIARASGERLADLLASAEMARRLMALQRQRLAESFVLDRRTRRVLHDDVLPRLHTALLQLSAGGAQGEDLELLAGVHRQISDLLRALPAAPAAEVGKLGLVGALRQVAEVELAGSFDALEWQIEPLAEQKAGELPALTAEVVYYAAREALRNSARHARPARGDSRLTLRISLMWKAGLELCVEDNGVGIAPAAEAGRSAGGAGQGLALHSTLMAVVNGSLALESVPGAFTRVVLRLPEGAPAGSPAS